MLIQFIVKNFKSFRNETTLSLWPANIRQHKGRVMHEVAGRKVKALSIAALFGANNAGKSNLLDAMATARSMICRPGDLPYTPFKLDDTSQSEPTQFEFIFTHKRILYHYGFAFLSDRITEEWLYAYYSRRESLVFERTTESFKVGRLLKKEYGKNKVWEKLAPNQLFINSGVLPWFEDCLTIFPTEQQLMYEIRYDRKFRAHLVEFMGAIDLSINTIDILLGGELQVTRCLPCGRTVATDIKQESHGTIQVMKLASLLYNLRSEGSVGIADISGCNIHPNLFRDIMEKFLTSPHGQLIFTTHEQGLLDLLRRDEIWLVDNYGEMGSEIVSLAEFKIRRGLDIQKGYSIGRFGGIPPQVWRLP